MKITNSKLTEENKNKVMDEFEYLSLKSLESLDAALEMSYANIAMMDEKGNELLRKLQSLKNRIDRHLSDILINLTSGHIGNRKT